MSKVSGNNHTQKQMDHYSNQNNICKRDTKANWFTLVHGMKGNDIS